jgi:DNA-binding transcriptional ArsR family regulator
MPKAAKSRERRGAPALNPSVAQLRALAHPLRLRLVELFGEASRTTMQVAEILGQPPTRLYHHVNALTRAGVLRVRETRKNRGTVEKWYELATPLLYAKSRSELTKSPGVPESLTSAVAVMLDHARHEVSVALSDPKLGKVIALRLLAVGTPKQIAGVHRRLRTFLRKDVKRPLRTPRRKNAPLERWAVTVTFAPVWPRGPGS